MFTSSKYVENISVGSVMFHFLHPKPSTLIWRQFIKNLQLLNLIDVGFVNAVLRVGGLYISFVCIASLKVNEVAFGEMISHPMYVSPRVC